MVAAASGGWRNFYATKRVRTLRQVFTGEAAVHGKGFPKRVPRLRPNESEGR
jgi:hypothetical protein